MLFKKNIIILVDIIYLNIFRREGREREDKVKCFNIELINWEKIW